MITVVIIVFIAGYLAIAGEHFIKVNKAAIALVTGVLCWTLLTFVPDTNHDGRSHQLEALLGEISGILFFLLAAMTIVELIDAHDGFEVITSRITTTNSRKLLWVLGFLTFILSAILDNLTTTIVMVSLLKKLIPDKKQRLLFTGMVIIAANAGGAWSPIGDVTTTMLWIGNQITVGSIIINVLPASLVCFLVPTFLISRQISGSIIRSDSNTLILSESKSERTTVFWLGIGALLFVPLFKTLTGLPPYMGILIALGALWVVTEVIHSGKDEAEKGLLSVNHALRKIDAPSILFFLGILLAIGALQSSNVLNSLATGLDDKIGNITIITLLIGLLSAIVDNVPLVAAAQGMYSMDMYPTGHFFWEFLAYCAGTGGSCLIIGSAAGVAAMGLEKIEFFWYMRRIGWLALIGYLAGAGVFLLQHYI